MTSAFTLGGEDIKVTTFGGFDLPDDVQVIAVLADGTTTHNNVLQQSAMQMPTATVTGRTTSDEEIETLRYYRRTHEQVPFIEPSGTHTIVVLTFEAHRSSPATFQWEWSATLIEVSASGSGS